MLKIYKQTVTELNRLSLFAFIAMLPYPHHAARICWVVFLISWLLSLQWLEKPRVTPDKQSLLQYLPFIGFAVYFLWNLISVSWAGDKTVAWHSVERLLNLFLVCIIAIWGLPQKIKWQECLNMLVLTCIVSVGVYMFVFYWMHNPERAMNKFTENITDINWFQVDEVTMHIKHRLHYSVLICAAIPSVWLLHEDWHHRFGRGRTNLYSTVAILVLIFGIYISGSRQSLITLAVIASTLIVIFAGNHHHRLIGMAVVLLLLTISMFGVWKFHPRFQDVTIKEMFAFNEYSQDPAYEPRLAIWKTALEHPQEYSLYGVGTGNAANYMTEKYIEKGWIAYAWRNYSPHNQYITVWIELGILAAILFVALLFAIPWLYKGRTRQLALLFTEIVVFTMFTESMFGRIEGVFFVCLMLLLLSRLSDYEKTSV